MERRKLAANISSSWPSAFWRSGTGGPVGRFIFSFQRILLLFVNIICEGHLFLL